MAVARAVAMAVAVAHSHWIRMRNLSCVFTRLSQLSRVGWVEGLNKRLRACRAWVLEVVLTGSDNEASFQKGHSVSD